MPVRLLIPRQIYAEMVIQAQAELPNECCGFLAGRFPGSAPAGEQEWKVLSRYPLVNKAASPVEYFAHEDSLIRSHVAMRALGLDVMAVYHSHPTTEPVPSRKDLERNYLGEVVHLIISLRTKVPVMKGWWLTEHNYSEVTWAEDVSLPVT
jgi:proteasome lid subunit RPN8/RPN11